MIKQYTVLADRVEWMKIKIIADSKKEALEKAKSSGLEEWKEFDCDPELYNYEVVIE